MGRTGLQQLPAEPVKYSPWILASENPTTIQFPDVQIMRCLPSLTTVYLGFQLFTSFI